MKSIRRSVPGLMLSCLALAASANGWAAKALDYPKQAITIVMPFPAGSVTDTLARRLAADLQHSLGQPVRWTIAPAQAGRSAAIMSPMPSRTATPCS